MHQSLTSLSTQCVYRLCLLLLLWLAPLGVGLGKQGGGRSVCKSRLGPVFVVLKAVETFL